MIDPQSTPILALLAFAAVLVIGIFGVQALFRPQPTPGPQPLRRGREVPPIYRVGEDGVDLPKARKELARAKTQLRKFKIEGHVRKVWDGPDEILADMKGGVIREAESAEVLKAAWERDMQSCFPQGPDYNVEYHCTVTLVEDDSDTAAVVAAETAALGAML